MKTHSNRVGIRTCSDYSPFGVELDGRTVSGGYRYGYQRQESDDEVKGNGNSVNYTFRMHDPRLGRFFSLDPFVFAFPHNSPYVFSENIVINAVELEGLEKVYVYNVYKKYGMTIKKLSHTYIDENLTDHRRVIRYFNEKGEIVKTVTKNIDDSERNPNKGFYDNMISSKWADGDYWESFVWKVKKMDQDVKDPVEGGKLIAATVGFILSGGTLAVATTTTGVVLATGGLILSLDEFTSVGQDETYIESAVRNKLGDDAAELFKGAKIALSVKSAAKGITNVTVKLAGGEMISGTFDTINQIMTLGDVVFDLSAQKKKGNKK
jgi:RHS repeat-associated protein